MTNLAGLTLAAPIPVAGLASDVTLDSIAAGSDITTNNVSTVKHGLCPKLPADATKYLDGSGAYTVPAGSGGAVPASGGLGDNTGNKTTTSGSFADTGFSRTIAAAAGDILVALFTGVWSTNSAVLAHNVYFQLVTTTGGNTVAVSVVDSGLANQKFPVAMCGLYTVVSGDISGGNVAVKAQFAVDAGDTLTVYNASGNVPSFGLVNLRH